MLRLDLVQSIENCPPNVASPARAEVGDGIVLDRDASYNLVDSNTIDDVGHFGILLRNSQGAVPLNGNHIRRNRIGSAWHWGLNIVEVATAGAPVQGRETRRNVIQENSILLSPAQSDRSIFDGTLGRLLNNSTGQGLLVAAPENVIRYNKVVGNNGGIALVANDPDGTASDWENLGRNRFYNNQISGGWFFGVQMRWRASTVWDADMSDNRFVNNLILDNRVDSSECTGSTPPLWCAGLPANDDVQIDIQPPFSGAIDLQGAEFRNNYVMDYVAGGDVVNIASQTSGTPVENTSACRTLAQVNGSSSCFGATFTDNKESGSTVDNGAFLTHALSCSGSTITVEDGSYFSEGIAASGMALVAGDEIQLAGSATIYVITGVALTPNSDVLAVTPAPSCSPGQGVSLRYAGTAPDIGPAWNQ
jgi:hypothetical protein